MNVCDFCKTELVQPIWEFPCADFSLSIMGKKPSNDILVQTMDFAEGWLACLECYLAITTLDHDEIIQYLATKNANLMGRTTPDALDVQSVTMVFDGFSEHRTGEPFQVD